MTSRDELRQVYLASEVEIHFPTAAVVVRAAPSGTARGAFPDHVRRHVHVITACNPYSQIRAPADNAARNASLVADLETAGVAHVPAVGRAPDHGWSEPSLAVSDADEALVLDLADRYEQHAVFVWTPAAWGVLWAGAHRGERDLTGWHAHR